MLVKLLLSHHCHSIVSTSTTGQKLIGLVRNVIESYKESLTVLQLEHFSSFLQLFGYRGRKTITITLAETLLENGVIVPSVEEVGSFILSLLFPCCFLVCPCLLPSFLVVVSLFVHVCCLLSLLLFFICPYLFKLSLRCGCCSHVVGYFVHCVH